MASCVWGNKTRDSAPRKSDTRAPEPDILGVRTRENQLLRLIFYPDKWTQANSRARDIAAPRFDGYIGAQSQALHLSGRPRRRRGVTSPALMSLHICGREIGDASRQSRRERAITSAPICRYGR